MRPALLVVALAACGGSRALGPNDWRETPPSAPCEVVETYTDAMGPDRRISKYSTDGRLLFAQTRLTYDGRGFEHLTWKNDRVVRIDTFYEAAAYDGNCDVEGGCSSPASRTVESSVYHYDSAGRLRGVDHEKREFQERGSTWIERDSDDRETRYRYDGSSLVAIEGGEVSDTEFVWQNGHPVERHFDNMRSTYQWANNRLVLYRWFDYEQSFEYDRAGRLVREVLASKSSNSGAPKITTWTFDAAGRMTSAIEKEGQLERPTEWTYDELGRLTSVAQDGRVNRTFEYGASCPANLRQPRLETAEARSGLTVCISSPGYSYNHCP